MHAMEPREVLSLDDINLSDVAFWDRPHKERDEAFRLLRRERPLAFFEEPELEPSVALLIPRGPGYWAVTRHSDVSEVSRHPEIYGSGKGATSIQDMPEELLEYFGSLVNTDDPRHAQLRRIVSAAFSPRTIKRVAERIELLAEKVIDDVAERGECDFVVDIAARLPLEVICDLMGISPSDYQTVLHASNVIVNTTNAAIGAGDLEYTPDGPDLLTSLLESAQALTSLVTELAEYRRGTPADDVTSSLVNANVDGESLTPAEVASFFILLVVAGNDTARNTMSNGLLAFSQFPEQRALWKADPEGIGRTGVDEMVRWCSPIVWMRRTVREPTVLAGEKLEVGDKLLLYYNSANRDEDAFDRAYEFDARRSPNPHVGFGAIGPHFCLGAPLARIEIDVMFRQLFERLPDIESVGEPDRLRSTFINGIKHLDCAFTPKRASDRSDDPENG
jgi:methyl-branched lipid omega-hydroxylase